MDYKELISRLRKHGSSFFYGAEFSDACIDAANAIEKLIGEREKMMEILEDKETVGTQSKPYGHKDFGNKNTCFMNSESCENCKNKVNFGKLFYCGYVHPRGGLFEHIKFLRGKCIHCKNWHKKLDSDICSKCLSTKELCNFDEFEE